MKFRFAVLFWAAIAIILLFGLRHILTPPTEATHRHRSPLVINEFMASNDTGQRDEDGAHSDWIEVYNRSSEAIELSGWSLTDDPERADKWFFPEMTLGADEYLLVYASGKDKHKLGDANDQSYLHTNFRLNNAAGYLALHPPTTRRYLDAVAVDYLNQRPDRSMGLCEDGETLCAFTRPTPGSANDFATSLIPEDQAIQLDIDFEPARGYYDQPIEVGISTDIPDAGIRYTTDGSEPNESNGFDYTRPIPIRGTTILRAVLITPDASPSAPVTHTYIYPDDITDQTHQPDGYPPTWGVYRVDFEGHALGTPVQADYEMDPDIIDHPEYGEQLVDSLRSLPVLSLVTHGDNLDIYFDDPQKRGPEAERPVSVELIYPDGSEPGFQIDAGVRIQGGVGRWEQVPKHPLRLFFKQAYGPAQLDYPLFPNSAVNDFNTLVLRAGANRSFAGVPPDEVKETTYARDEWARRSQIEMSGVGSHGLFAHLFLNGMYWGLYNVVERPDAAFTSSYYGGDPDSWYAVNHGGSISGQIDRFAVLLDLAEDGGLADPDQYATMLEFIDPAQFSDYVLLNWYAGTDDWPETNWYAGVQYPAGHNLFFVWDAEGSWRDGAEIRLGDNTEAGAPFPNVVKLVFEALAENPDFRMVFADRLYKHLFNGGALAEENAQTRWLDITGEIEPAIVAESARWGDVRYESPITPGDWKRARDNVLGQMEGNAEKLVGLARSAGYYPAIDPPQWSQHGGAFEDTLQLTMNAPAGDIYFTLDGSDPREASTAVASPTVQRYEAPITLSDETTVKARVLVDGEWSALREAKFTGASQRPNLRITELMYHPLGGDMNEFIELQNGGDAEIDLSGARFEGIDFVFPEESIIKPSEIVVLIKDFPAYRQRYAQAPWFGIYGGNLANSGETIVLFDRQGNILDSVSYDDENGWPVSADGLSDSLILIKWDSDPNQPSSWDVSRQLHGSPGEEN